MLAGTIWQRELVEFAQRRRALIIKLVFPLLVAVPLVLSGAPTIYAAMALTMLAAIIGALGSGAVLTRERQSGLTLRYRTLPVTPGRLLIERLTDQCFDDGLAADVQLFCGAVQLLPRSARRAMASADIGFRGLRVLFIKFLEPSFSGPLDVGHHGLPQDAIHPGLISFAALLQPGNHIGIEPH